MKITVNGKLYEIEKNTVLLDLLKEHDFEPLNLVVSVNDDIIQPDKYTECILNEGAVLDIMAFVGGG